MDLSLSLDGEAFRQEVRAFIRNHYPPEMRVPNSCTDLTKQQILLWRRILHKKGWTAPSWPKEFGGTGWSITQRYIWEQGSSRSGHVFASAIRPDHGWSGKQTHHGPS